MRFAPFLSGPGLGLIVVLAPLVAVAEPDIFDRLAGRYGDPFDPAYSCEENPETISFSPDRTRVTVSWDSPIIDYLGMSRTEGGYTVLSADAGGITMLLEGEQRRTDDGATVVWVMRPAVGIDGYCWGRTDWHPKRCENLMLRCKADPLLG